MGDFSNDLVPLCGIGGLKIRREIPPYMYKVYLLP